MIDEAIYAWRYQIGRNVIGDEETEPANSPEESPSWSVRRLVWDKLAPHLHGCTTVVVVPDQALAVLLVPVGLLLFRERMTMANVAGIALCIVGMVLITRK